MFGTDGLNGPSRSILLSLRANQAAMAQAQSRLASGLKVASPLDGPASFFAARGVNARADRLEGLLDDFSKARSALQADDSAVKAVGRLIDEMATLLPAGPPPDPVVAGGAGARALLDATGLANATELSTISGLDVGAGDILYAFAEGGAAAVHDYDQDGTTVGSLIATINAAGNGVSASLNGGRLELTAAVSGTRVALKTDSKIPTPASQPGLRGSLYRAPSNPTTIAAAEAVAANAANRISGFRATNLDYPNGAANAYSGTINGLLGTDAATLDTAVGGDSTDLIVGVIEGKINVSSAGTYTFQTRSDDGFRLTIDGVTVSQSQNWWETRNDSAFLTAGEHEIRMIFYGGYGPNGFFTNSSLTSGNPLDSSVLSGPDTLPPLDLTISGTVPADVSGQLEALRTQIGDLVADSRYGGFATALGNSLGLDVNERGTSFDPTFDAIDTAGLGLANLDLTNTEAVRSALEGARETLQIHAGQVAYAIDVIDARDGFTRRTIETLREGGDNLTLADPNEEGARLLAAQTQGDLASTALSVAADPDRFALRMLDAARSHER